MKYLMIPVVALALASCNSKEPSATEVDNTTKTTTTVTTTTNATPSAPTPTPHLSTLTQANLDLIQNDMSQAEVEAILGKPTSSESAPIPVVGGTQTTYNYQDGDSAITVIFKNNQVKEKKGIFNP